MHNLSTVDATESRLINRTSNYFDRNNYALFNKQVEAVGRENISDDFKNKIEALRAESDLYECNEYEVAVLTGSPIWRLRDLRSEKNNHYPFKKLKRLNSVGKLKKSKRNASKVVYPFGMLKASICSL
jgi:hypothetical protein|tara:strand:- start:502 stop:885 length:384 start_codon:yes stop_codon:yes gene_type:complete